MRLRCRATVHTTLCAHCTALTVRRTYAAAAALGLIKSQINPSIPSLRAYLGMLSPVLYNSATCNRAPPLSRHRSHYIHRVHTHRPHSTVRPYNSASPPPCICAPPPLHHNVAPPPRYRVLSVAAPPCASAAAPPYTLRRPALAPVTMPPRPVQLCGPALYSTPDAVYSAPDAVYSAPVIESRCCCQAVGVSAAGGGGVSAAALVSASG